MKNVLKLILGSANDRIVKSYEKTVSTINKLEPKYAAMSDDEIHGLTSVFRERLAKGEKEKDFYTSAEVDKLTKKQLSNPKVMETVLKSMLKW